MTAIQELAQLHPAAQVALIVMIGIVIIAVFKT